ncbi:MAG: gliding motility-associated C-terminal domain-containing protein [Ferruginibacter sp.]
MSTTAFTPYNNVSGTSIPSIYIDDKFSSAIPIAFPFCFYGLTYNNIIVGSNSIATFEAICANASNAYTLTVGGAPQPLPYNGGGGPSGIGTTYYPRTAIMAGYQDIDPSDNPLPTRRIEYNVFGTAPCRKFVVSFVDIRLFNCPSLIQTSQIVLHESTGLIEVFLKDKPLCSSWPSGAGAGLAILGIQDETRTKFAAPSGKNCTQWSETSTGYRFIPSGGTSKFVGSQLFTLTGTLLATADTITTVPGLLDLNFPNFCPPAGNTQFVIKTTFSSCLPGPPLESMDTITINSGNNLNSSVSFTPTTCGASVGTITITVPPGSGTAPYTYRLNAGAPQASNTFTGLAAGTYTATVTDALGCSKTFTVIITSSTGITGTYTKTDATCPGVNNGTITITPTAGNPPFQYRLNGGPPQASNIFPNLAPGTYTVTFTDAGLCQGSINNIIIGPGTGITATFTKTDASCAGVSNGTITINPNSGSAPYRYSLNSGPLQGSNIFTNLAPGTYSVTFTDVNGCQGTISNIIIGMGGPLSSTFTTNNPPCANINNGSVVITPTSGTAPYQFSLNAGPSQVSGTFNGLAPGTYSYTFTDAIGCGGSGTITLTTNSALAITIAIVMPLCKGNANGTITLTGSGGVSAYQYSKDLGATYQPSGAFTGLIAGTYSFRMKDNVGCIKDTTVTISEPSLLTATTASGASTCNGNDGTITVTASGGTTVYQYSIDNGVTYQASNLFTVAPGSYPNIKVKDANGCTTNTNATVILTDNMFLNSGRDTTICVGQSVTFQPITNPQTNIFKWRPNATIANDSLKNAVATPTDTTKYILHATWGACQREDTLIVNVLHKPVADAGFDTTICFNTFAVLRGSASNLSGGVNYTWSPAAEILLPNQRVTVVNPLGTGTHIYTLTVTDNYGCNFTVTDAVNVTVNIPPPAYAGNDTIAIKGVSHQLFGNGGTNYLWTPLGPLDNPFAKNPKAILFNDTRFILMVTDNAGCIAFDTVFVKVYEGPTYYIPNSFTPNGDGLNDIFRAIPVGISKTDWFRIFNRYGEMVFETNQWLKGWDGTFKGKPQGNGVYIWVIKGTDKFGKPVEMKGTIMLIR